MITPPKNGAYLLDTNVLMGFSLWHPQNRFPIFWNTLETALIAGQWVLLDIVVNEILYDPQLKKWCSLQKTNGHVHEISPNNKVRGVDINNLYPLINPRNGNSQQDPYIVAFAEEHKLIVFTRESGQHKPGDPFKIPEVCDKLKVGHISLPEKFFSAISYSH